MGEFNSDDHYIYYCGQESLRRNGVDIIVNKSPKCSTWKQSKKHNDLCSFPRQTIQYYSNPSLCPKQLGWRSWSWMILWRPIRLSRTNTPIRCPLHYRGLECKSRKSRDTWRQGKFGLRVQNKVGQRLRVLTRECSGHSKHPLPTTQEMTLHMDITRRSILKSDWLYSLQPKIEKLYTVSKNKTGTLLWLRAWTPYCQIQT